MKWIVVLFIVRCFGHKNVVLEQSLSPAHKRNKLTMNSISNKKQSMLMQSICVRQFNRYGKTTECVVKSLFGLHQNV